MHASAISRRYSIVPSPVGRLWLIAEGDALTGCWFDQPERIPDLTGATQLIPVEDPVLAPAARVLELFFDGDTTALNEATDLPLHPVGTPLQQQVWAELRRIPLGATCSYADVARAIGRPRAFHPVGQAVGRNPISILIPCHRVIGSDGSLTGYGGGVDRKIELLTREGVTL